MREGREKEGEGRQGGTGRWGRERGGGRVMNVLRR